MFFCGEAAKKKQVGWFKVERFGGGGLVGGYTHGIPTEHGIPTQTEFRPQS